MKREGDNVIRVDFRATGECGKLGGSRRFLFGVFCGVVVVELLLAATLAPQVITTAFFGPVVVGLGVWLTMCVRTLAAKVQVGIMHKRMTSRCDVMYMEEERSERTLH